MHPGGMTLLADSEDEASAARALNHTCLVVSVDYRLAPENLIRLHRMIVMRLCFGYQKMLLLWR